MTTDLHGWADQLDTLLAQVWSRLVRGVGDRHAPARHPTFATVSAAGWPEQRTVVLRAVDVAAGSLDIHTDLRSDKVAALRHVPRAALHIWDPAAHLQTRLAVDVTILTGAEVVAVWAKVPEASRLSYGAEPSPGQAIEGPLAYQTHADPDRFAVLRCRVVAIDALHLGPQHRRGRFGAADGWAGQWLTP